MRSNRCNPAAMCQGTWRANSGVLKDLAKLGAAVAALVGLVLVLVLVAACGPQHAPKRLPAPVPYARTSPVPAPCTTSYVLGPTGYGNEKVIATYVTCGPSS
jgi:hypothetical protein